MALSVELGISQRPELARWPRMQVIEQRQIGPHDDAAEYRLNLPRRRSSKDLQKKAHTYVRRIRAIKVRHLLTHTSGYTYSIWSDELTRYENDAGMPDSW